jgi:GNAT superfamily N-acetyltransferase
MSAFWRLLVTSALRYPWTLVTEQVESAAVWIPPGGIELTDAEHDGLEPFLTDLTGPAVTERILVLFDQFDAARPSEPHFYLSLLATHNDHRGSGLGMGLLQENLARVDAEGLPAYLESCNPVNDKRYASVGFAPRDEIRTPSGHVVTTMWRPARPEAVHPG